MGYSPQGPKELDMTKQLTLSLSMSLFVHHQRHLVYLTLEHHPTRNPQQKLCTPLLTHSISHSTFSIHHANLFLCFSCVFSFLEVIKYNMPRMLLFPSIFYIKMATQKSPILMFFKKCTDMTAVTIQSNKIVSKEVKDNWVLWSHLNGKKWTFCPTQ